MRLKMLSLVLGVSALGCGITAYFLRHEEPEGAYFDTALNGELVSEVKANWFEPFDYSNPYLRLGAAIGLAVAALAIFLVSLWQA